MDDQSPVLPPSTPPSPQLPLQVSRHPLNIVFFNDRGLRSGWRIVIYLFQILLLSVALSFILGRVLHVPKTASPAMWQLFLQEGLSFLIVFLPALVMSRIESRPAGDYGLPVRTMFGLNFWHGCLLGIAEISVLVACIAAFGGYRFGALDLHGPAILRWALLWAIFFVMVGLFEEFTFRGYLQFTLADGIGFWPAAWILSLGFGSVHLMNKGESPVGALSVVSIALVFALALRRTGNLWLVVGWHAAFDFGETFLFSVPNSGNVFEGHLSNATLHGPVWLTGGTVGPEGSVFSFVTMAVAAFYVHKVFPKKNRVVAASADSSAALPVA
ncbi:MAG TPA: type II CAAX endopeptidase family protein [Candidatus Acidoferrum sp.]|nr:type II CAAX endopeptidase family protein [Candidatus Acidoferrum sp.]